MVGFLKDKPNDSTLHHWLQSHQILLYVIFCEGLPTKSPILKTTTSASQNALYISGNNFHASRTKPVALPGAGAAFYVQ